jgi:hypothetical protein
VDIIEKSVTQQSFDVFIIPSRALTVEPASAVFRVFILCGISKALGVNMSVLFDDPALPAADLIKHHVFAVHDLLEQLMKLAHTVGVNDAICAKINQFYGEVLFNFMRGFGNCYSKQPGATPIRLDGADTSPRGPAQHSRADKQPTASNV